MRNIKEVRMNNIKKSIRFGELMQDYPEAIEILTEKGMHCLGCPAAMQETLEQGAMMHGIDADKLVEEINKKLGEGKSGKKK